MATTIIATTADTILAGEYTRMSMDRWKGTDDEGRGVDRQRSNLARYAGTLGWTIVDRYQDNDVSATSGARREEFERLCADIESGRINAVVCDDQDRFVRLLSELERVIKLRKGRRLLIASPNGGVVDLGTDGGRLQARVKGAFAQAESERKAKRQRDEAAQRARDGRRHHSGAQYGFCVPLVERNRTEQLPVTINEEQAEIVREMARRILAGEGTVTIAADLNKREVRTVNGRAWTHKTVRSTMIRASISGRREYTPLSLIEETGQRPAMGEIVSATSDFPAIITADDSDRIRRILTDPGRKVGHRNPTRLLSGIARCGKCSAPMRAGGGSGKRNDAPRYRCVAPDCLGVMIKADTLDEQFSYGFLSAIAEDPALVTRLLADDSSTADADTARMTALRGELTELLAYKTAGDITLREWIDAKKPLDAELKALETQRQASDAGKLLDVLTGPTETLAERWEKLAVATRRNIIAMVVDQLVVKPVAPGKARNVFVYADRVTVVFHRD